MILLNFVMVLLLKLFVLRMRMVDDIELVFKVRLNGLNVEYRVFIIMVIL